MHQIKDGTGKGYLAKVTKDNRLSVFSASASVQLVQSLEQNEAYQVIGTSTLSSGTTTALHVQNSSSTKNMIITYMRHQVVDPAGGAALPNTSNYFSMAFGREYVSGGSLVTPVNVFAGAGKTAELTCYQSAPVLSGTADEIDRWYTKDEADMNSFRKEGAVIIPPNRTIELSYVGDQISGLLYARMSFLMREI